MGGNDESHTHVADLQIVRKDAAQIARGTVLAGRYEIEAMLGRGGAGVVLRAFDRELREAVAIKVLHPDLAQETRWIERLAREVKLARQLRHPNVCRVFDFEKADGHVFIVMELATGGSMRHELQELQGLQGQADPARSPDARLADARAIAEGLAAIHQAGIAHRDVTPQNVLRMADGRLVVSDFGLATEVSQTTASVHGGTIAYMAPEVVRGQRADFAADVWSLGVVIHEIMFGVRPAWNKATGGSMLTPAAGRTLAKAERLAYDVCRACTAERPRDRPASAGDVAAWLGGQRRTPRHRTRRWLALGLGTALALTVASRLPRTAPAPSAALEPSGEPADWTDTSTVLATVEGRIDCLVSLPGTEAVRFAWGNQKQVDDLDLSTGQRRPSLLVPEARQEGCALPSPDGKHLVYQGYIADGRAFAFVSDSADGSAATPVVPIADPSLRSDPSWLSNSREFVIDIDHQHAAVFSLDTHRAKVLRDVTSGPPLSVFRGVAGMNIFAFATSGSPIGTDVAEFEWPLATEKLRFRIAGTIFEMASPDGKSFFMSGNLGDAFELWRAEPATRSLKRVAVVRDQGVRLLAFTRSHLVFISRRDSSDAWRRFPDGHLQPLTHDGRTISVAPCGRDLIVSKGFMTLSRLDGEGRPLKVLEQGHDMGIAVCSPDGTTWYESRRDGIPGVYRCDVSGCSLLVEGETWTLSISPDGERLAVVRASSTGLMVAVVATTGGESKEVTLAEGACAVGWSSVRTLWVPKRHGSKSVWVEVDVESRTETGRTKVGAHDCANGIPDPDSPLKGDLEIITRSTSQIRSIPLKMLGL